MVRLLNILKATSRAAEAVSVVISLIIYFVPTIEIRRGGSNLHEREEAITRRLN
jgi:hypothetical protein